jgi:hypothetical protein
MDGASSAPQQGESQVMNKQYGLFFASVLLCSGSAQAFQLNAHTPPTIHQLNPQPLPPGMQAKTMDRSSPTLYQKADGSKGSAMFDKHKDW